MDWRAAQHTVQLHARTLLVHGDALTRHLFDTFSLRAAHTALDCATWATHVTSTIQSVLDRTKAHIQAFFSLSIGAPPSPLSLSEWTTTLLVSREVLHKLNHCSVCVITDATLPLSSTLAHLATDLGARVAIVADIGAAQHALGVTGPLPSEALLVSTRSLFTDDEHHVADAVGCTQGEVARALGVASVQLLPLYAALWTCLQRLHNGVDMPLVRDWHVLHAPLESRAERIKTWLNTIGNVESAERVVKSWLGPTLLWRPFACALRRLELGRQRGQRRGDALTLREDDVLVEYRGQVDGESWEHLSRGPWLGEVRRGTLDAHVLLELVRQGDVQAPLERRWLDEVAGCMLGVRSTDALCVVEDDEAELSIWDVLGLAQPSMLDSVPKPMQLYLCIACASARHWALTGNSLVPWQDFVKVQLVAWCQAWAAAFPEDHVAARYGTSHVPLSVEELGRRRHSAHLPMLRAYTKRLHEFAHRVCLINAALARQGCAAQGPVHPMHNLTCGELTERLFIVLYTGDWQVHEQPLFVSPSAAFLVGMCEEVLRGALPEPIVWRRPAHVLGTLLSRHVVEEPHEDVRAVQLPRAIVLFPFPADAKGCALLERVARKHAASKVEFWRCVWGGTAAGAPGPCSCYGVLRAPKASSPLFSSLTKRDTILAVDRQGRPPPEWTALVLSLIRKAGSSFKMSVHTTASRFGVFRAAKGGKRITVHAPKRRTPPKNRDSDDSDSDGTGMVSSDDDYADTFQAPPPRKTKKAKKKAHRLPPLDTALKHQPRRRKPSKPRPHDDDL